jgi:hypothetical protein
MGKSKRIDAYFKKKDVDSNYKMSSSTSNPQASVPEQCPSKMLRIESQIESVDSSTIEHAPGLRRQIWNIQLINMMKLDVLILKTVHIHSFLMKVLDIHFRELEKIVGDFNHLGIRCLIG